MFGLNGLRWLARIATLGAQALALVATTIQSTSLAQSAVADPAVSTGESPPLAARALDGLASRPDARIEDAYKWLFQATRGAEHAAPGAAQARQWLAREWAALGPAQPEEPLIEFLRHDAHLVRVNLRPAKARGVTIEALLQTFLTSAAGFRGSPSSFEFAWSALGERLRQRTQGHLTRAAWERFDAAMKANGYPAVHHSDAYRAAYAPAYRVLLRADAEALMPGVTK